MSDSTTDYTKKLIEVSIPLKEINEASAREKSIRHGHPSTLHLWWARRPLAAARAVLFCQLVDDPSGYVDELVADKARRKRAEEQLAEELKMAPHVSEKVEAILVQRERERLHDIVKELVVWENTNDDKVLNKARKEIQKSWARTCRREGKPEDTPMPPFLDPFAGGGAIPLEAQRLGLEAHASDLNPVAVLINKAMIEIPPKFADMPPVHADAREEMGTTGWKGAAGLAEDVRRYGQWMRDEAFKRIGNMYPPYKLTNELIDSRPDLKESGYNSGDELTVVAWLWARTVQSPNPALGGKSVPLVSTFFVSTRKGQDKIWVDPVIENGGYRFRLKKGLPNDVEAIKRGTRGAGRGGDFVCLLSGAPISAKYIREEAKAGRLDYQLMAVVCEGRRNRIYLPPTQDQIDTSQREDLESLRLPSQRLPEKALGFRVQAYGMEKWIDLFTPRQLTALATFSELIREVPRKVSQDFEASGQSGDGGDYGRAVSAYLAFALSKLADRGSSICTWFTERDSTRNTFSRHAIPMTWDFAELNVMLKGTGSYLGAVSWTAESVEGLSQKGIPGIAIQADAAKDQPGLEQAIIGSDPPYYDNIGYADLSDFFYVWLREALRDQFPELLATMLVPKAEELIASPFRHDSKGEAEEFFIEGMKAVCSRISRITPSSIPYTLYYAFKQTEQSEEGLVAPGWATFLGAIIAAGGAVTGTWPMRTELSNRMIGRGTNALASSVVLACRHRPLDAPIATRKEFVQALRKELPNALAELQHGNIAPVDLPQSSIGPGMGIFSRYSKVIESDGTVMSVKSALQLINQAVDEFLTDQEAQMDDWTRFATMWFSTYRFDAGSFGDAQNIATAKGVTVDGVATAGIVQSGAGKVQIIRPENLPEDWDPLSDGRPTIWEIVHHLIRILREGSEDQAAKVIREVGGKAHDAKALCYRIYTICEQNKWAEEARDYNLLMTEWTRLQHRAEQMGETRIEQGEMFE